MKALLIRLKSDHYPVPPPDMPLGILYLASSLENAGHDVVVRDLNRQEICPADWEQIKSAEIRFVGISFLAYARSEGFRLAKKIKALNPHAYIIAGGVFPQALPDGLIERYPFDAVVLGEGERAIIQILDSIASGAGTEGIPGIYTRAHGWGGPQELIADLDSIPFPARHHSNYDWYKMTCAGLMPDKVVNGVRLGSARWMPIIASRGCVGRCIFCNAFEHWGNRVRFRSADNILDEIEDAHRNSGVTLFAFNDDAFPLRKSQCAEFCEGLIRRGINIAWQTTTRGDTIDAELAALMARAGCFMVAVGVESGSETIHAGLGKKLDLDKAAASLRIIRDAGMISYALMMIGNPGESDKTITDTINWLRGARPNWYSFVRGVMITPGSKLCDMAVAAGQISNEIWLDENTDGLPIYTVENSRAQFDIWADKIEREVPRFLQ